MEKIQLKEKGQQQILINDTLFYFSVMIQIYDEPAEAIKTAHKKGKKLTSTQVFGMITVEEFQEHDLRIEKPGWYLYIALF